MAQRAKKTKTAEKISTLEILRFIFSFTRPFRLIYAAGLAACLAVGAISYLLPLQQKNLLNLLAGTGKFTAAGEIWWTFGICAVLFMLRGALVSGQQYIVSATAQKVIFNIKKALLDRLLFMPAGLLKNLGGGYITGRFNTDTDQLNVFYSSTLLLTVTSMIKMAGGLVLLFYMDWRAGIPALLALPLYIMLIWFFRERYFVLAGKLSERQAENFRRINDSFGNIELIKSHGAEENTRGVLNSGIAKETVYRMKKLRAGYSFVVFSNLIPLGCQAVLITAGVYMIVNGKWSIGTVWALNCYLAYVFFPVRQLCGAFMVFQTALASGARIRELYSHTRENISGGITGFTLRGEIELDRVSFAHADGRSILQNVSWHIRPGSHVTLSGESGSGKTTLLGLLLGLYLPDSGEIRYDGRPLREYDLKTLRCRIGYLGADTPLMSTTLRENLLLGVAGRKSDAEIFEALARANAADIVNTIPGGLDAEVWENGSNFSSGEKLRLALARELLRDADILLCDEAESHLDMANVAIFRRTVAEAFADRTVISVVHPRGGSDDKVTFRL